MSSISLDNFNTTIVANSSQRLDNSLEHPRHNDKIFSFEKLRTLAIDTAKVFDYSRETAHRTALDVFGFDIPEMIAGACRNFYSFSEASLGACKTVMITITPNIMKFVAKTVSSFLLPKEEQKDYQHYMRFKMEELDNMETFKEGVTRVLDEEVKDTHRVASLYEELGKNFKAALSIKNAEEIQKFCINFEPTEAKRSNIYKLKKNTMLIESLIESMFWGSYGLVLRFFRKNILGQNRFTGTKSYLSDEDSKKLGEVKEFNILQKFGSALALFIAPIFTAGSFKILELNKGKIKSGSILEMFKKGMDTEHGFYPKIGLLAVMTMIPSWLGKLSAAQGPYETVEKLLTISTVVPSWWLGQRLTNGLLAKKFDKELSEKFGVERGIILEPKYLQKSKPTNFREWLAYTFPNPARYHHVNESSKKYNNRELSEQAKLAHAKTLYGGFALHSTLVFLITMLVNQFTKLRVMQALKSDLTKQSGSLIKKPPALDRA